MKEQVERTLVEARKTFDIVLQQIDVVRNKKQTKYYGTGRELSIAYTELQIGRMWLGEILDEIGRNNPYAGTNDAKKPSDIAPAADKANDVEEYLKAANDLPYIESIGGLRKTIDATLADVERTYLNYTYDKEYKEGIVEYIDRVNETINYDSTIKHIKTSRMCLGLAMGIIRDKAIEFPVTPDEAYKKE